VIAEGALRGPLPHQRTAPKSIGLGRSTLVRSASARSRQLMAAFSCEQLTAIHAFLVRSYESAAEEYNHLIR
jgi:hypothetical protein